MNLERSHAARLAVFVAALWPCVALAGVRSYNFRVLDSSSSPSSRIPNYYVADTKAELDAVGGLIEGDLGSALDTGLLYYWDGAAWVDLTVAAGAPTNAEYIVAEANGSLSAEVAPSAANQVPVSSSSTAASWTTVPDAALASNYSGTGTCTNQFARVLNDNAAPTCATVVLGTDTSGSYAAGDGVAGNALTGDTATAFFSAGQIEAARGGTGDDTSATTGVPRVAAGNWTYDAGVSHLAASTSADLRGVLSDEEGAPGVNGWTTDCSTASNAAEPAGAAQVGAHLLQDPASGNLYLTQLAINSSIAETYQLIDVVWYNTGLVVTTTGAQAFTMVTLPARDINGSSNGEGYNAAILATAALGNAATISNTTISYMDQDGNAGATGTFVSGSAGWQAPATPLIGTWMPFALAAGDRGIRDIDSITLATSYTSGSMSLVVYRTLLTFSTTSGNYVAGPTLIPAPGIRIYPNSCLWVVAVGSASASLLAGSYTIVER